MVLLLVAFSKMLGEKTKTTKKHNKRMQDTAKLLCRICLFVSNPATVKTTSAIENKCIKRKGSAKAIINANATY
eukprot:m.156981 g.156981  ORF g.156981 m.156981 type:complete len:74 (+) comp16303_c2_seq1:1749-1970(+)